MGNMADAIRLLAVQAQESGKPSMRLFGVVTSLEPLKIQVNEKLTLSGKSLAVTQTVRNYIKWKFIEVGDKVVMTRQVGGQLFIVDDMLESDKDFDEQVMLKTISIYLESLMRLRNPARLLLRSRANRIR